MQHPESFFTLTAEADRVLCQIVMFLTVCFLWMYKMKSYVYNTKQTNWIIIYN